MLLLHRSSTILLSKIHRFSPRTSLSLRISPVTSRSSIATMSADKLRVVITNEIPPAGLAKLRSCEGLELDYPEQGKSLTQEEIISKLKEGADVLYCLLTNTISSEVLAAGGARLKHVATMSVGYNHIDMEECFRLGISVSNTPDCLTETTADTTVGLVLATCRRFKEATASVEDGTWGKWEPLWMCGPDVNNSTVGIIGLGRIGAAVAKRLKAFNCKILYTGSKPKPKNITEPLEAEFIEDVDDLLERSDIVIPLCPLNENTKEMFNLKKFSKMKKSAVFINAARGDLVKQDDLIAALKEGLIFAAGLDVTTPEPLPVKSELIKLPNCFILPHIGSASVSTRNQMSLMAADNVLAFKNKEPLPNRVTI